MIPIPPSVLATLLSSGGAQAGIASALPALPTSAIAAAPAQLAAQQAGGINNIGSALGSMGASPSAASPSAAAPTTGGLGGIGGFKGLGQKIGKSMDKIDSEMPQHHPLVQSAAQFMPLEAPRTNPYAPASPASLFDMLQNMYGA